MKCARDLKLNIYRTDMETLKQEPTNNQDNGRSLHPVLATGLEDIKNQLLNYRNFYGGDISETDLIKNATSMEDIAYILDKHERLLEDMLCDARSHLNNFRRKIGLFFY